MFQITEFTEAHLASVTNRVEKHGDDDKPSVSLGIHIEAANTLLDVIDPKIRHALYMAVEGQEELPGVEPSTPVLRCNSFESHKLTTSHEGWTLAVDDGIDHTSPMTFGGCKVDKFTVDAKQGGSIVLRLRVGTSDVDAEKLGNLAMHIGQSIWVTITAPEKKPEPIDGTTAAFKADHPDAGTLFAQEHGGEPSGDGEPTGDEGSGDSEDDPTKWPFPKNAPTEAPPQSATTERASKRTARGRDKTKAALEAGSKAHAEAGAGEAA